MTLDPGRRAPELERQVRALRWMFESPSSARSRSSTAGACASSTRLDDPGDPAIPRLDAADGPLWLTSVEEL